MNGYTGACRSCGAMIEPYSEICYMCATLYPEELTEREKDIMKQIKEKSEATLALREDLGQLISSIAGKPEVASDAEINTFYVETIMGMLTKETKRQLLTELRHLAASNNWRALLEDSIETLTKEIE